MVKLLIWSPWPHFCCIHSRPTCRSSDWESLWCFACPPLPEHLCYIHSTSVHQQMSEILQCLCRNSVLRSPRNACLKIKWHNIIFKLWCHHYVFIMSEHQQFFIVWTYFEWCHVFLCSVPLCIRKPWWSVCGFCGDKYKSVLVHTKIPLPSSTPESTDGAICAPFAQLPEASKQLHRPL